MKINIILPVFNDWESLNYLLEDISLLKTSNDLNFSTINILIINDGSTSDIKIEKKFSNLNIKILHLFNNIGSQKAINIGLRYIKENKNDFDYCIIMDSDGEDKADESFFEESAKVRRSRWEL